MFDREMKNARSGAKLGILSILLIAGLGAMILRMSGAIRDWVLSGFMIVAAIGFILLAWGAAIWLRHRQRRRLMDMRDSALW